MNTEAIQALSGSISHMASVISQFQDVMDKNKKDLCDETWAKPTNIENEPFEYGNLENICNANKAEVDSPIVSNEFTNPIENNGCVIDSLLNESREDTCLKLLEENSNDVITASCPVSDNNLTSAEQTTTEGHQVTYANAVASHPALNNSKFIAKPKKNNKPGHTLQNPQCKTNGLSSDPEGLIGVERKRKKTKKFFVTGIAENVKESQILYYLERRNIIPTHISIFPS